MRRFTLALLLAMPMSAFAQAVAPPAHETDAQKFVRLTREIETQPIGAVEDQATAWLMDWSDETPDYVAVLCLMAGSGWEREGDLGGQLMMLASLGNIAWQIEHGADTDELSKQFAGTETALRIYSATVAKDPSQKSKYFDSLLKKQKKGTLRAFMAPHVEDDCVNGGVPKHGAR